MKPLLILIAGIGYILALICLTHIVFLPNVGFWINLGETGYATSLPNYFRTVCLILLISLLGSDLYLLWRGMARLA
jgi:hypothetical protein